MQQRSPLSQRARRLVAVVAVMSTLFAVTAATAAAESAIGSMVEVAQSNGDLGSGANEFSGSTYNADRNVVLVVDDEANAYEFDLNQDGSISNEDVRVISINIPGPTDYEGVAWIENDRYAFLNEGTGIAYIANLPGSSNTVNQSDVLWQFTAGGPDGNTGSEGIAVGGDGSFYVTDEMPASVSKYNSDGTFVATVLLPELGDATGVVAAEDNSLVVISHESGVANHYEVNWAAQTRTQIGSIDLGDFSQLEGVAIMGNDELHFFGEEKGGQTYARFTGNVIAPPEYELMDVNCDGEASVVDALLITRIEVGTSQADPECGSGDSNGDGDTTVVDAMLITQCIVGLFNVACPEA